MMNNTVLSQSKIANYQVIYLYNGQEGGLRSIVMLARKVFPTPSYKLIPITLNEVEIEKIINNLTEKKKGDDFKSLTLSSCNVLINNKETQFILENEGYKCVDLDTSAFTTSLLFVYKRLLNVESILDYNDINSCNHSVENISTTDNKKVTCNICKEHFNVLEEDTDLVSSVNTLIDALNTIKFINMKLKKDELYDIGCLIRDIKKIPDLFSTSYKVLEDLEK